MRSGPAGDDLEHTPLIAPQETRRRLRAIPLLVRREQPLEVAVVEVRRFTAVTSLLALVVLAQGDALLAQRFDDTVVLILADGFRREVTRDLFGFGEEHRHVFGSQLRKRGCELPIVALTANAMAGDRERCIEAGCTAFEPKPVNRKALLETLARLLPDHDADS